MRVTCYPQPGKRKSLRLNTAFAAGCGGRLADVTQRTLWDKGPSFFYGWTPQSLPLIKQCQRDPARTWFYADNAYIRFGDYFRITQDRYMHDGEGGSDSKRLDKLDVAIQPWRRDGRHILVVVQSTMYYSDRVGVPLDSWVRGVVKHLQKHTDRKIRVRLKLTRKERGGNRKSLDEELSGAWALVTHSSSAAVTALCYGVPIFSLGESMASMMGRSDLSQIESPVYPAGRRQWLSVLADNQWTLDEIRSGVCWRRFKRP